MKPDIQRPTERLYALLVVQAWVPISLCCATTSGVHESLPAPEPAFNPLMASSENQLKGQTCMTLPTGAQLGPHSGSTFVNKQVNPSSRQPQRELQKSCSSCTLARTAFPSCLCSQQEKHPLHNRLCSACLLRHVCQHKVRMARPSVELNKHLTTASCETSHTPCILLQCSFTSFPSIQTSTAVSHHSHQPQSLTPRVITNNPYNPNRP